MKMWKTWRWRFCGFWMSKWRGDQKVELEKSENGDEILA